MTGWPADLAEGAAEEAVCAVAGLILTRTNVSSKESGMVKSLMMAGISAREGALEMRCALKEGLVNVTGNSAETLCI